MSTWIRADLYFGDRCAVLTVPRRDMLSHRFSALLARHSAEPDEVAALVTAVVEEVRPDLAGGILQAMCYQPSRDRWELLYSHPSLPRLQLGLPNCHEAELPLVPEVAPDAVR